MATPSAALVDTGDFEAVTEAELVAEVNDDAAESTISPREQRRRLSAESGLRPSPAVLAARIEAAMAASAKTESTLSDLLRTAKFLSASINAVREANAALVQELEVLCSIVDGEGAERSSLERRIQRLERRLEDTGDDAARERRFLVEEHDAFIASLVSDHERELFALRERLAELENEPETRAEDSVETDHA
jgi:hypothetical protein